MKFKSLQTLILFCLLWSINNFGQNCVGFYKQGDCEHFQRKDFYLMSHSRSSMFEIGVESEIKAALSGGHDYIFTCCTEKDYYPIHMQIITDEDSQVVYDNMHDDYNNSVSFTLDNDQIISIKVKLLANGVDPEDFQENRTCLGITIQYRKVPKMGF